jgi:hypothetical protein
LEDTTVRIPLHHRDGVIAYALISAGDAHWITQFEWRRAKRDDSYAYRLGIVGGIRRPIFMHREILGLKHGDPMIGDHINRDRLDNRRENLRAITRSANSQNVSKHKRNAHKYRGVAPEQSTGLWFAQLRVNGQKIIVGRFADEDEAGAAVRAARLQYMPYAVD